MRCKSCGRVMQDGLKKCPHCGNIVHVGGLPSDEFTWNVPEYKKPEPRKKVKMDINWQNGQIIEKETGRMYSQSDNKWIDLEQDEDQTFSFDLNKNKRMQSSKKFDPKSDKMYQGRINSIEENYFTIPPELNMNENVSRSASVKKVPESIDWFPAFDVGSSVEKRNLSGVTEQKKKTQGRDVKRAEKNKSEEPLFFGLNQNRKNGNIVLDWNFVEEFGEEKKSNKNKKVKSEQQKQMEKKGLGKAAAGEYAAPEEMQVQQYDPFEKQNRIKGITMPKFIKEGNITSIISENVKPDLENGSDEFDTAIGVAVAKDEIDAKTAGTFQKLIGIEQRFSDELNKIVYMSEEEIIEERRVQRKKEKLIDVPKISYLTIEDEFDKYCLDNGIKKMTKFPEETVKKIDDSKKIEKKAVSLEEKESLLISNNSSKVRITDIVEVHKSDDASLNAEKEGFESEADPFLERKNNVNRLTITDIFGPEARKLIEDDNEEEKSENVEESVFEESVSESEDAVAEEKEKTEISDKNAAGEVSEAVVDNVIDTEEIEALDKSSESLSDNDNRTEIAESAKNADLSVDTIRVEAEEIRNLAEEISDILTIDEKSQVEDTKESDEPEEEVEKIEEFVYVVDEERPTKQEILNMTSEEIERQKVDKKSSESNRIKQEKIKVKSEKEEINSEKTKQSEKNEKKKLKIKRPVKIKKPVRKKKEKVPRPAETSAEKEKNPKNKIYKVIIAVLIVAICLEFFIFAVKVLNPDSFAGEIIRGIEGIFKGSTFTGLGGKFL